MKFIAFVLDMVDYDEQNYEGLFETEIEGTVEGHHLKVITDFTVAKVTDDLIEQPYFFFSNTNLKKGQKTLWRKF